MGMTPNNIDNELEKYFNNSTKISSARLKKRLFECRVKEKKCEQCGIITWQEFPAPLELHHEDGNNKNNNLSNLKILCSNCHALTSNFRASNKLRFRRKNITFEERKAAIESSINARQACIKLNIAAYGGNYAGIKNFMEKYDVKFREKTEEEKVGESKAKSEKMKLVIAKRYENHIYKNANKKRNKYSSKGEAFLAICKVKNRPSKDDLLNMVWEQSLVNIGKTYGVSDKAVKKWAQKYNIPVPPVGYWRKLKVGRIEECKRIKEQLFKQYGLI